MLTRRAFSAFAALFGNWSASADSDQLTFGRPEPFSFEALTELARASAARSYKPVMPAPDIVEQLDYDQLGRVRHPLRKALFPDTDYPSTFFHLGGLFRKPLRIFAREGSSAREIIYRKALFESPVDNPARNMPDNIGFAGFRLHDARLPRPDREIADWVAFLGASYFRSSGDEGQYGISARGVAIDTVQPSGEEFPDFTQFYISAARDGVVEVFALLDGPSLSGAYQFLLRKRPTVTMEVSCSLFFRRGVARLGIAPATSMYYYSETYRYAGSDYRPEVHDSDGLALWMGNGEQIWRPLNNPGQTALSAFSAVGGLKGFGLLQRDRSFASYRDPVHYQRRPHLWIEPLSDWGEGSVELIELPTRGEYHDNVVAFWRPAQAVAAGDQRSFRYRLHWGAREPMPGSIARCVATRLDKGFKTEEGEGQSLKTIRARQFLVEFEGEALAGRDPRASTPVLTLSRGVHAGLGVWPEADGSPRPWRVSFEVRADGEGPVEMRLFLKFGKQTISETWVYQYVPTIWAQ